MSGQSPSEKTTGSAALSNPDCIRKAAQEIWSRGIDGALASVKVKPEGLVPLAEKLCEIMREGFPDLQFPPAGCWRLFESGAFDRWGMIAAQQGFDSREDMIAAAADLAVLVGVMNVSFPGNWRFLDPFSGEAVEGEEARAIAALTLLSRGYFSSQPQKPLQVDATALCALTSAELRDALQIADGPEGDVFLDQLTRHLVRCGEVIGMRPDLFNRGGALRPGNAVLKLLDQGKTDSVKADELFQLLFNGLAPLWVGGAQRGDLIFADAWDYQADAGKEPDILSFQTPLSGIVSSLLEPLAWAGVSMVDPDQVPLPADLESLCLLCAFGVLDCEERELKGADNLVRALHLRALTMAGMHQLVQEVRRLFEVDADSLPATLVLAAGLQPLARAASLENSALRHRLASFLAPGIVFWLPFRA